MARLKAKTAKKTNSINTIGARLQKARESKDISLEEVQRATKIHPNVLKALEEDRVEKVLGATYIKAFMRHYADYLGLDADAIVSEYSSQHSAPPPEQSFLEPRPIMLDNEKKMNHTVVAAAVIIVWALILSFAAAKMVHSYKIFAKRRRVAARQKAAQEPKKTLPAAPDKGLILIPDARTIVLTVTVDEDTWLKVMQDGSQVFRKTLPKNSRETWKADGEIVLSEIGKPDALHLNVNGKNIDLSGSRLGKSVSITRKGIDISAGKKN